jgi:hypothetical protein
MDGSFRSSVINSSKTSIGDAMTSSESKNESFQSAELKTMLGQTTKRKIAKDPSY